MAELKLNDTVFTFNNIYYVSTTGNDVTGDGSEVNPFQTVNYAVDKCASSGDAIYALEGVHDVTSISSSYGRGGLYDGEKSISFFGVPSKTIFLCDGSKHTSRDHHAICTRGVDTKIYNIIFDVKYNGRTLNYSTSIAGNDSTITRGDVYNCVFLCDATPSMSYNNNSCTVRMFNCIFITPGAFQRSYSNTVALENCATNYSFYNEGSRKTCLNNVVFDDEYRIKSDGWIHTGTGNNMDGTIANIGVYGGIFEWKLIELIANYQDIFPSNIWFTETGEITVDLNISDTNEPDKKLGYNVILNGNKIFPTDPEITDYISNPVNVTLAFDKELLNMGDNKLEITIEKEEGSNATLKYTLSKEDRDAISISRDVVFESEWDKTNTNHTLEGLTLDLKIRQGHATTNDYSKINTTGKANINSVEVEDSEDIIQEVYFEDKMSEVSELDSGKQWEYIVDHGQYNNMRSISTLDLPRKIKNLIESDGVFYELAGLEWKVVDNPLEESRMIDISAIVKDVDTADLTMTPAAIDGEDGYIFRTTVDKNIYKNIKQINVE